MKTWKRVFVYSVYYAVLSAGVVLFLRDRTLIVKEVPFQRPAAVPSDWVNVGSEYAIRWGAERIIILCDDLSGFVYYMEVGVMFPPGEFFINVGDDLLVELHCADGNIWLPERITNPNWHPGQDYPPDPPWLWPPDWFFRPTPVPQREAEGNL